RKVRAQELPWAQRYDCLSPSQFPRSGFTGYDSLDRKRQTPKAPIPVQPDIRFFESMVTLNGHRRRRQPIAAWAALQALLAGATLDVNSNSNDRANGP